MTTGQAAALLPGVHRGIPADDYHAMEMVSYSRLKVLHEATPMHLRHRLDRGDADETSALRLGTALHKLVLEGREAFDAAYAVGGPVNPRTGACFGADTKAFAEWAAAVGRPVLSDGEASAATLMANAIWAHPGASEMLRICKDRELTVVDDLHGQRCKCRIDAHGERRGKGIVVDIKTVARGAGKAAFMRSIGDHGYGLQAALYESLAASQGLAIGHFCFVAVESVPPHAVAVYRLRNEVMDAYEQLLPILIERYGRCVQTGVWPGWPDEVQEIGLPEWLRSSLEREINTEEADDE